MGAGLAVGAAVADGELGSVMGSMLLNVHVPKIMVPTTHTTSHILSLLTLYGVLKYNVQLYDFER